MVCTRLVVDPIKMTFFTSDIQDAALQSFLLAIDIRHF